MSRRSGKGNQYLSRSKLVNTSVSMMVAIGIEEGLPILLSNIAGKKFTPISMRRFMNNLLEKLSFHGASCR
jgi:hypothetical protein